MRLDFLNRERKDNTGKFLYFEKLSSWIHKKYLNKKGKILDAGSGTGVFALSWNELGYDVEACDLFPTDPAVKKVDLDKHWPYEDGSFDYVFMWHVIEHLRNQDNWISEARRILKKGGKLIIGVPNWKSGHKTFFDVYTHKTPYTIELLNDIAKNFNFDVQVNKKFRNIPYLWRRGDGSVSFNLVTPFKPNYLLTILTKR